MRILSTIAMVALLAAGACAQLPKPIDSTVINTPGELDRVIRTALNRISTTQTARVTVHDTALDYDTATVVFPNAFSDTLFITTTGATHIDAEGNSGICGSVPLIRVLSTSSVMVYVFVPVAGDSVLLMLSAQER